MGGLGSKIPTEFFQQVQRGLGGVGAGIMGGLQEQQRQQEITQGQEFVSEQAALDRALRLKLANLRPQQGTELITQITRHQKGLENTLKNYVAQTGDSKFNKVSPEWQKRIEAWQQKIDSLTGVDLSQLPDPQKPLWQRAVDRVRQLGGAIGRGVSQIPKLFPKRQQTEAQPTFQGLPGQKVRVKELKTGRVGTIEMELFDPKIYERL